MSSNDGKISIHAPFKPLNDNHKLAVTNVAYIKGADQIFQSVADFIAFHPSKMVQGMTARIINYPKIGNVTEYFLKSSPETLVDGNDDSIITLENFASYWDIKDQNNSGAETIREFAPSKTGGARPTFPYTASADLADGWTPIYDPQKNHKWMRFRTDDVDDNSDGVFDNWSLPVQIGEQYEQNDYIENRFIRSDVSETVISSSGGLQVDKYYIVLSGTITVNSIVRTAGSIFQHKGSNTYSFNSATTQETLPAPPSIDSSGNPNNEPTGYSDTIPSGSAMLWVIEGQKNAYGALKSSWTIRRIKEDPNYIRYSFAASPIPNTLCDTTEIASVGQQADTDLSNCGWENVYSGENFIATRQDDGANFTQWRVEKINEESGEFQEYAFKLFDFNLPVDSVELVAPTASDPTNEGWFDVPQAETSTKKNYVTSARKFIDGTLKSPWSKPVPYTAFENFILTISSSNDDDFKKDQDGNVVPSTIDLTAELFKGVEKLWENSAVNLTFSWKRVYDNGSVVDNDATSNSSDDFYTLAESGTPGTSGYKHSGQVLRIKPAAVTGKAVFRATVVVTMDEGDDITIHKEFSILDVSDGKDARDLSIKVDSQSVIYDTTNTVFIPTNVELRYYYSHLASPTLKWFHWNGSSWTELSTGGAYTISSNVLKIAVASLFTGDGSAEEERFAVTNHASDPDSADGLTTFSDYKTIAKLGSTGVGSAGADALVALLDNESANVVLDDNTIQPVLNEIGSTGRVITKLQLFEGQTKKVYGGGNDYTVAVSPNSGDIQFAVQADGDDARIYISQWSSSTARSATCTITITYGAITVIKKWQIGSALDSPGALVLDIDSDKGFAFTPQDRTNKILTANLFDSNEDPELQTSGYDYHWKVAGVFDSWTTTRTKTITRANIAVASDVTVEVRKTGTTEVLRSKTIKLYDIIDSRVITMLTDSDPVTSANKIGVSHIDDSNVTVSGVTWRSVNSSYWDSNDPVFACQGEEDPSNISQFIWSNPYRIKGEGGSQGPSGGFYFKMYKQNGTSLPSGTGDTSTLSQMTADGWLGSPPLVDNVYQAERLWVGEGVVFDGNELPSTGPVSGTKWKGPNLFTGGSGNDGNNGVDGVDGNDGWSPVLALKNDGSRRVLQLDDWIGGEGTKPGNVGKYVGSSGYVSSIGSAVDIRGASGQNANENNPVDGTALNISDSNNSHTYVAPGVSDSYRVIGSKTISNSSSVSRKFQIIANASITGTDEHRRVAIDIRETNGGTIIANINRVLLRPVYLNEEIQSYLLMGEITIPGGASRTIQYRVSKTTSSGVTPDYYYNFLGIGAYAID